MDYQFGRATGSGGGDLGIAGGDRVNGSPNEDTLKGNTNDNEFHAGGGNDTLWGEEGNDILYGDDGDDTLYGGPDNDKIYGGSGNDSIAGGYGDDTVVGGEGNDIIDGGAGSDTYLPVSIANLLAFIGSTPSDAQKLLITAPEYDALSGIEIIQIDKGVALPQNAVFMTKSQTTVRHTTYQQAVSLAQSYSGDTFDISFGDASWTITTADAAVKLREELERLSKIHGVVAVTGNGTPSSPWIVEYTSEEPTLADTFSSADVNVDVGTQTVVHTAYQQEIFLDDNFGGTEFAIKFGTGELTISKASAASELQAKLEDLAAIQTVAPVTGDGTPSNPWIIEYTSLAASLNDELVATDPNVHVGTKQTIYINPEGMQPLGTYHFFVDDFDDIDMKGYGSSKVIFGTYESKSQTLRIFATPTIDHKTTTGGSNTQNEVQTFTVNPNVTGGTFKLSYNDNKTEDIVYNASAENVQKALRNLSGLNSVTVSKSESLNVFTVAFSDNKDVKQLTSDTSLLIRSDPILTMEVIGHDSAITEKDLNFTRQTSLLAQQIGGSPSSTYQLGEQDLAAIREEAISRWTEASGNDPEIAQYLDQLVFTISDLDGRALATTFNATVRIDVDAAGNGWFFDLTPAVDEEFVLAGPAGSLVADPDSVAYAQYDLLTVVMHEIGHTLGLADINQPGALMNRQLSGGTRARITAEDAALISFDAAATGNLDGTELSDQEKILGGLEQFALWTERLGNAVSDTISLPFIDVGLEDLWERHG